MDMTMPPMTHEMVSCSQDVALPALPARFTALRARGAFKDSSYASGRGPRPPGTHDNCCF